MKKIGTILALWVAGIAMVFGIIFACEKDDGTSPQQEINGYKLAKGAKVVNTTDEEYIHPDVKAELRKLKATQKDYGKTESSEEICAVLRTFPGNQWIYQQNLAKEYHINVYTTECTGGMGSITNASAQIGAISIIVDYDETKATIFPFDYATVHPDILYALSQNQGALVTNSNNGKFYFAWYCLYPVTVNFTSKTLFSLSFWNIYPGATIGFDTSSPGNNELSIDGWESINLVNIMGETML